MNIENKNITNTKNITNILNSDFFIINVYMKKPIPRVNGWKFNGEESFRTFIGE